MRERHALIVAGLLVCFAGLLRFYSLGGKSLWVDEITTKLAAGTGFGGAIRFSSTVVNPPLHYVVAVPTGWLGDSEASLRFPAALLGTLSIPLFLWLAVRSGLNPFAAVIASLFLCFSPFHIRFSQDARMYSYVVFFTVLSTLAMVSVLLSGEGQLSRRRAIVWGAVFVLSSILNVYTSYFSFLLLGSQLLFLMICGAFWLLRANGGKSVRALRLLLVTGGLVVFAYLPWLPVVTRLASHEVSGQSRGAAESLRILSALGTDLGGGRPVWGALMALAAGFGLWRLRASWLGFYSIVVFLVPLGALFSIHTRHFVATRYFAFLVPQYYLLAGCGGVTLAQSVARLPAVNRLAGGRRGAAEVVVAGLIAVLFLAGFAGPLRRYYGGEVQNWREAARVLLQEGKRGDMVVCGLNMSGQNLRYYISRLGDVGMFRYVEGCRSRDSFMRAVRGRERGWFVTSHAESLRTRAPDLWRGIHESMVIEARLPALEEWGEIWIFRLKRAESASLQAIDPSAG